MLSKLNEYWLRTLTSWRMYNAAKAKLNELKAYEAYIENEDVYNEQYRRAMLNDYYMLKDKYNTFKMPFCRRL